ncbi:hypothetical protein HPB47_019631, partial [Ixodes persulcatus]
EQRAISLQRTYGANPGVLYVDAAEYRHQGIFTAAVTDNLHSPIDAVTLLTTDPETAEEVAITLAFTVIPTPSRSNFLTETHPRPHARTLVSRETRRPMNKPEDTISGQSLYPYHEARSARDPDKSLILEQAYSWRQLQTGTFPNPATLTHIFHSMYPTSECPLCGDKATLPHRIWACPENPIPPIPSHDEWEASLRSSDPEVQRALVERAMERPGLTAENHGYDAFLATTRRAFLLRTWRSHLLPWRRVREKTDPYIRRGPGSLRTCGLNPASNNWLAAVGIGPCDIVLQLWVSVWTLL